MRTEKALAIKNQKTSSLRSLFHMAKLCHYTSERLNEELINHRHNLPKGTPQWVKYFLNGYEEALRHDYMNNLEFCYTVDGTLYSIRKKSPRYYENHFTPKELNDKQTSSGFYYIDTEKPYFVTPKDMPNKI